MGWFFGLVGFSFYAGNIYGAENAAFNYNNKMKSNFVDESIQQIQPMIEKLGKEETK